MVDDKGQIQKEDIEKIGDILPVKDIDITADGFLESQGKLEAEFEELREKHRKELPNKPLLDRNGKPRKDGKTGATKSSGHEPGTIAQRCDVCKEIAEKIREINEQDLKYLGSMRIEPASTKNTINFIRRIVKMMKNGGEL